MVSVSFENMKRILAKNQKSLIFAQYADMLRCNSSGDGQKLDEALLIATKGVEANPDFLPGKLARGRIFLEKGDFAEAKTDFEIVAKRDPFCLSAQKLLLETAEKLNTPLQSDVYEKILSTLSPAGVALTPFVPAAKPAASAPEPAKAPVAPTPAVPTPAAVPAPAAEPAVLMPAPLAAALDSIVEEEEMLEHDIEKQLLKAVDNIIQAVKRLPAAQPAAIQSAEPLPLPTLPEATSIFDKEPPPAASEQSTDVLEEPLLAEKMEFPDSTDSTESTSDINALLDKAAEPEPEPEPEPAPAPEPEPEPAAPQLDAILAEQLADKADVPDFTGDMDALLAQASAPEPAPEPKPASEPVPEPAPAAAPQLDAILAEQLADKADVPDYTGDMDALLAQASVPEPAPEPEPKPAPKPAPAAPQLDAILAEQLADKADVPDFTSDMDALLGNVPLNPALESTSHPPPDTTPQIDAILKEQLTDRAEAPDLTGDMAALLGNLPTDPALESNSHPSMDTTSQIDAILKEQLTDRAEVPDLTGDMKALLAGAPGEPDLIPYTPKKKDVDTEKDEILTQNPTETLAEIYMSQGLPKKAAAVYKELLTRDPNNDELKAKLDLAETQAN